MFLFSDRSICDFMTLSVILARPWVPPLSLPLISYSCPGWQFGRSILSAHNFLVKKAQFLLHHIFYFLFPSPLEKITPKERFITSVHKTRRKNSLNCPKVYWLSLGAAGIREDKIWGSELHTEWLYVASIKKEAYLRTYASSYFELSKLLNSEDWEK